MSSSNKKKTHHERGHSTSKPSSSHHKHHHSRDSAIGSSTVSDRASVGTAVDQEPTTLSLVEEQRHNLRVVQEALDAANETIKLLKATNLSLSDSLADSNKENRSLKKEKSGLLREMEDLLETIDDLNKRLRREASPRSMAAPATASAAESNSHKPSPSTREADSHRREYHEFVHQEQPLPSSRQASSSSSRPLPIADRDRRSSLYERQTLPTAPIPPVNHHPNPFLPRTAPTVTYSPAMALPSVSYSPSSVAYTTATAAPPLYAISTGTSTASNSSKRRDRDDGRYHLEPL